MVRFGSVTEIRFSSVRYGKKFFKFGSVRFGGIKTGSVVSWLFLPSGPRQSSLRLCTDSPAYCTVSVIAAFDSLYSAPHPGEIDLNVICSLILTSHLVRAPLSLLCLRISLIVR
eukprot:sb/3476840/